MSSQINLVDLGLDGGGVEVADGAAVPLLVVLVEVQCSVPQRAAAGVYNGGKYKRTENKQNIAPDLYMSMFCLMALSTGYELGSQSR